MTRESMSKSLYSMSYLKLIAVGDIVLQGGDNKDPFEKIKDPLRRKDILFGNLETVLSEGKSCVEKSVSLFSSPKKVKYLKDVRFDVLNIANNHILDLGSGGFHSTLSRLRENKLNFIGGSDNPKLKFYIQEEGGIRLGFSGYSDAASYSLPEKSVWVNEINENNIIKDIKSLKQKCDFVIISLHWGIENAVYPSPEQIRLARKLIDSGADVILGHHPHIVQGIEKYKNRLIAYSLGNFQFDPRISLSKYDFSIILEVIFSKNTIKHFNVTPISINKGIPALVTDKKLKNEILNFIINISQPIISGHITSRWWFEQIATTYLKNNIKSFLVRIKKYGFKHFLLLIIWIISPFCINCYLGYIRRLFKKKNDKRVR